MKRIVLLPLVAVLLLPVVIGCMGGTTSTEDFESKRVSEQQKQYAVSQPPPVFDWSLERDIAIQLYQARNERVRTWTVWRSDYGMIEGHSETIGYPIPYDVQLTNPEKIDVAFREVGGMNENRYPEGVIEQAEPNGLYSSKNSIATWIRAVVNVDGKFVEAPIYIEGKVTCYPYPVEVDYDNNRVKPVSGVKPSVIIKQNTEKE